VVPVVETVADLSGKQDSKVVSKVLSSSDDECSADNDCDVDPGKDSRFL